MVMTFFATLSRVLPTGNAKLVLTTAMVYAPSDLQLAQRCVAGDRAAQSQLFDAYFGNVHATLYRILGSNREIDDLVQESFIQIFRSLESYRGDAKLTTWVARISARVAFAHLSRKRPASVALESIPEPAISHASAERQAIARQVGRRLYALLDELDAKHRIAFTLHVIDGRSLEEVARVMDSTVLATKSRVFRARRKVRADPVVAAFLDEAADAPEVAP